MLVLVYLLQYRAQSTEYRVKSAGRRAQGAGRRGQSTELLFKRLVFDTSCRKYKVIWVTKRF